MLFRSNQLDVVKGDLARLQDQVDRLGRVDFHRHLLAAREQVVFMIGIVVWDLITDMGSRHHLHATADRVRMGERDPGGDHVGRIEAPIRRVLVPGDEAGALLLLDEESRGPAEDVRADRVLDRIQDLRVMDQLVRPGEEQVRLVPPVRLDRKSTRLNSSHT